MEPLSQRKKLGVIRLYLGGSSYDEIAARLGISKGAVANIINDLKAGRIIEEQDLADHLDILREVSRDLERLKLTPDQAIVGLASLSRLQELGIEPSEIQRWAEVYRQLAGSDLEKEALLKGAQYMQQLRQRTGLTFEQLETKANSLQEEVSRLEPRAKEYREYDKQLPELAKRQKSLLDRNKELEKRNGYLPKSISQKQQRESVLDTRIQRLEQRGQDAEERLEAARRDLRELADLGLSRDDLRAFAHRVGAVAQRHMIKPQALRDRLMHELEVLDSLMSLDSAMQSKQAELGEIEAAIAKAGQVRKSEERALKRVQQQQEDLRAAIAKDESLLHVEIKATARIAQQATSELRQELQKTIQHSILEVLNLKDEAFELGQELGRFQSTVDANNWLTSLLSLVKGDGSSMSAGEVRVLSLTVLRGAKGWIQQKQGEISAPSSLTKQLGAAIEEFEQWKT